MIAVPALRTSYPLAIRDKIERLWRMCAFRAPFGGAFQPVFGGDVEEEIPWYLSGDISAANCLAAHQPLGAASLAASYNDIAHVATTWDCAPGTAPTHDPLYGWAFASASSQYLVVGSGAIASATPLTMICLFQGSTITTRLGLTSICKTNTNNKFAMYAAGELAGDPILLQVTRDGASVYGLSTSGYTANNWFVACVTYTSSILRNVYIDGGSKGSNADSNAGPSSLNATYIGCSNAGGGVQYFHNGKIAADAWYDKALSDAEVLAVSNALLALVA